MKAHFFRHSLLMLFSVACASGFNMLFQLLMVRWLRPVDYGILNALFAIFMICSIPGQTIQTTITKFTSRFLSENSLGKAQFLFLKFLTRISIYSILFIIFLTLIRHYIAGYLHIDRKDYIVLLAIAIYLSYVFPFFAGALGGMHQFGALGIQTIANSFLKLVLAGAFLLLGYKIAGAFSAMIISAVIAIFISYLFLRKTLLRPQLKSEKTPSGEVYTFFGPTALALLSFMVLTNVDLILVKHLTTPEVAGGYSVASMAGKIILFLPQALILVMFPKTVFLTNDLKKRWKIFKKSLLLTLGLCTIINTVLYLFPQVLNILLAGDRVEGFRIMSLYFSLSMTLFAILNLVIHYNISIQKMNFVPLIIVGAILHTILITLFHKPILNVLQILLITSSVLSVTLFFQTYYQQKRLLHAR